jgi:hypothetical protein
LIKGFSRYAERLLKRAMPWLALPDTDAKIVEAAQRAGLLDQLQRSLVGQTI